MTAHEEVNPESTDGTDDLPLLSRLALTELYMKLGDYLSDPPAQRVMRELTGPDKVYIPPEDMRDLRNELIEAMLTIVIPIAWWDWELKQEQARDNVVPEAPEVSE